MFFHIEKIFSLIFLILFKVNRAAEKAAKRTNNKNWGKQCKGTLDSRQGHSEWT